jgi:hypothetical protein
MKRDACASTTETSVSRAVEYLVNPRTDLLGSRDPAWHACRFPSSEYAAKFRELNPGLIWTPTKYARESAKRRRSYYVQLIILAAFAIGFGIVGYPPDEGEFHDFLSPVFYGETEHEEAAVVAGVASDSNVMATTFAQEAEDHGVHGPEIDASRCCHVT